MQVNDTELHVPLKTKYWELGQLLMIDQLRAKLKKIAQPTRDDMMRITCRKIKDEEKIKDFRDQLKKKKLKKSSQKKKLLKSITSPKGVRQRDGNLQTNSPIDKGTELLDCDGESYRMAKLMSNLNLMTKSTTIKLKMQQILLVIIKSPTNSYSY